MINLLYTCVFLEVIINNEIPLEISYMLIGQIKLIAENLYHIDIVNSITHKNDDFVIVTGRNFRLCYCNWKEFSQNNLIFISNQYLSNYEK